VDLIIFENIVRSSAELLRKSSSIQDQNTQLNKSEKDRMLRNLMMMGFDIDIALYALKTT
jgi:hypothetical protein